MSQHYDNSAFVQSNRLAPPGNIVSPPPVDHRPYFGGHGERNIVSPSPVGGRPAPGGQMPQAWRDYLALHPTWEPHEGPWHAYGG